MKKKLLEYTGKISVLFIAMYYFRNEIPTDVIKFLSAFSITFLSVYAYRTFKQKS